MKQDVEGHHDNLKLLDGQGEAGDGGIFVSTKGQGTHHSSVWGQALRIILSPCQTLQQE